MTEVSQDARTRATDFRGAMATLSAHQKTSKGAPAYSRYVNRRLGRYAAAAAYAGGLTPNQVTAISAAFTFSAIAALALVQPSRPLALFVSLALLIGYALDSADGQLARLRGGGSLSGEWLDHVIDAAKTAGLHAAVLVSFYRFFDVGEALQAVPLLYLCLATTWFFTVVLTDQLRRSVRTRRTDAATATSSRAPAARSLLALPTDYGVMCLLFLLFAEQRLFAGLYTAMLVGSAAIFGAALVSWFRELSSYDRAGNGV